MFAIETYFYFILMDTLLSIIFINILREAFKVGKMCPKKTYFLLPFFLISLISIIIIFWQALYLIDTSSQTYVEECINWQEKNTLIVRLGPVLSAEILSAPDINN